MAVTHHFLDKVVTSSTDRLVTTLPPYPLGLPPQDKEAAIPIIFHHRDLVTIHREDLEDRVHILTDLQAPHLRLARPTLAPEALALDKAEIRDLILLRDTQGSRVARIHSLDPVLTVVPVVTRVLVGIQDTGQACRA